eukprot:TRINITY_DN20737_c0_g1_i1.p1 TRINITY_DN20737_c0_g1~~TRINITY_DN20737_c0_g1_i1.p1  ORF type:complete len:694 (+),score=248.73 TRINITY_DN20737_c0_g1_i1:39-2084(+)
MFASWLCNFKGAQFPGYIDGLEDNDEVPPGGVLIIDPATYPAVGRFVPDPKDPTKRIPGMKKSRLGLGSGKKREVKGMAKTGLRALPPLDSADRLGAEVDAAMLAEKGYCTSLLIRGPYFAATGYGTVLTTVYYQPPAKKEVGETAEQINARVHPPFVPPTAELRVQEHNANKAVLYKIGPGAVAFKVVLNTFNNAGMRHTADENWNLLWTKRVQPEEWGSITYYQRVNHFPGTWGIGRKDYLHKNVSRFRRAFGEAFAFTPTTWVLPQDTKALQADMTANPGMTYIMKPCASSCGKGIKLITKMPQMLRPRGLVIQRYIPDPMLVGNRKFDLRIYVCVTGFDPLKVYVFDEGLCRFAAEKYPGPGEEIGNSYAHLTNYSISKTAALKNEEQAAADEEGDDHDGPRDIKWMLSELKAWFLAKGEEGKRQWKKVAEQIQDVVVKTMITIETDVCNAAAKVCSYPNGHGCFELFGFDLMMDSSLKLYVLEVNIMPSLATGNPMDKAVKNRLLAHLVTLVGVAPFNRTEVAKNEAAGTFRPTAREAGRTCKYINGKVPVASAKRADAKAFFESLTDNDRRMIIEAETELDRAGGFKRVFPTPRTWAEYSSYFDVARYNNEILAKWEVEKEAELIRSMQEKGETPVTPCYEWDTQVPKGPINRMSCSAAPSPAPFVPTYASTAAH